MTSTFKSCFFCFYAKRNNFHDNERVLVQMQFSILQCRGQCYDGAANISGCASGLRTRVQEVKKRGVYVHCLAHKLNLAVQDATRSSKEIRDVLALIQDLIAFIHGSPNAWPGLRIFEMTTQEMKKIPAPILPRKMDYATSFFAGNYK